MKTLVMAQAMRRYRPKAVSVAMRAGMLALLTPAMLMVPSAIAEKTTAQQAALARIAKRAVLAADKARSRNDRAGVVAQAERAVAAMPYAADYRRMLGDAYLAAGRFRSAETAFADAPSLQPDQPKAVLGIVLSKIALGQSAAAQEMLATHQSALAVSDYGLALALAGDPKAAADVLTQAVRHHEANGKIRQNLALALALSGRWDEARAMAAVDLPPDLVNQRVAQWAGLAKPEAAWTQVASLMGITPQPDAGQPQALALALAPAAPVRGQAQLAAALPSSIMPQTGVRPVADRSGIDPAMGQGGTGQGDAGLASAFLPPPPSTSLVLRPAKGAQMRSVGGARGYVVQIGAFRSPKAAAIGWRKASARWAVLRRHDVRQARVQLTKGDFYRLSVGGFATRSAAGQLCAGIRAKGGQCFVRTLTPADGIRWAARADQAPPRLLALR